MEPINIVKESIANIKRSRYLQMQLILSSTAIATIFDRPIGEVFGVLIGLIFHLAVTNRTVNANINLNISITLACLLAEFGLIALDRRKTRSVCGGSRCGDREVHWVY